MGGLLIKQLTSLVLVRLQQLCTGVRAMAAVENSSTARHLCLYFSSKNNLPKEQLWFIEEHRYGLVVITEGAIPFSAARPSRIPSFILGSAVWVWTHLVLQVSNS